jgi:nicotinate phosphoribosyltransferase
MMIQSLLDTDLYKFTMMQVVLHHFPGAEVEYRFRCRRPGVDFAACADDIRREVAALCTLRFSEAELDYLRSLRFIKPDFVEFLRLFQLSTRYIEIAPVHEGQGELDIRIRGPWLHTILFEVPVLAIVNETYFRHTQTSPDYAEGRSRLTAKLERLGQPGHDDCKIADYGTRRRFSRQWQEEVVKQTRARLGSQYAGTSNVWLAATHDMTPLGTMAHEYVQACQALGPRLRDSQIYALEMWAREYRGDLGIALSDTVGFDAFLRDFDLYFCKLFDGVRHDSGDPLQWGERMLAHYASMRVDARSKLLVFSDGLNAERILELYSRFRGRCELAFGIGTDLTNDLGYETLPIVIKMTRCNGQPVAKLSDSPDKTMSDDPGYLAYLRQVFTVASSPADIVQLH